MTRIVWTEPAVSDLNSIRDYIARDSELYADAVVMDIFDNVDRLATFPISGRVVPELNEEERTFNIQRSTECCGKCYSDSGFGHDGRKKSH